MIKSLRTGLVPVVFLLGAIAPLRGEISVTLSHSEYYPFRIGTFVTWRVDPATQPNAENPEGKQDTLWFRFRVKEADGPYRVLRDFGPEAALTWAEVDTEGLHEMEISIRNQTTGEVLVLNDPFDVLPVAQPGGPDVIRPTPHPLVFIYSTASCREGSRMRVSYVASTGRRLATPFKACDGTHTMNFYVAGLPAASTGFAWHEIQDTNGILSGSQGLPFATPGKLPIETPKYTVATPRPDDSSILLRSALDYPAIATDLAGNVVWYSTDPLLMVTRPGTGGTFWGFEQSPGFDASYQRIRHFDLASRTLAETNAGRLNEQLEAMGKRPIGSFHHEVRELPGGRILILASVEQGMEDVQGPGWVNVLGDMLLVLNPNLQVEWTWDAFDHLDPSIPATLGETCPLGGCPPTYLAEVANDWLHSNSVQLTPDGNILLSIRHLDVALKLDYRNGEGDGHVIWRLGKGGDFRLTPDDPSLWFSHQHDVQYLDEDRIILFDNNNIGFANDPEVTSRGQVYRLDERNRTARLEVNLDLGVYSLALGSGQQLPNGNYHFNIGFIPPFTAQSVELAPDGRVVYSVATNTAEYRTVRMQDLFTPY